MVSGTASDNVGVTQVTWTNSRGGSGTATGTTSWSATGIALQSGTNVLTVTARDAANNAASATLTVTYTAPAPPPATQLAITTQPSATAQSGVAFAQQPRIQLRDAANSAVSQSGVVVTAAIATGVGTLSGTATATTNASGLATFTNLSITGVDGDRTLRFTAGTLTTATSTIVTLSTPPVSPPPSGSCPNEPAGSTTINDQSWDQIPNSSLHPMGWIDDDGRAASKLSTVNDPTSPYASANHNVVAGLFRQGDAGGSGPFYVYRPFASGEQFKNLYICVYMKHSANFDNSNGNAGTKFLWPAADRVQGAETYVTFDGSDMNVGINQQGATNREMYSNLGASGAGRVLNKRGSWVRYEFLLKGNTSGSANGEMHIWLDGVKTHQYTNVNWTMGSSRTWQSLAWNPTYGGGLNPVPHDQWEYIDNVRITGGP
jgi:hypothetical protein